MFGITKFSKNKINKKKTFECHSAHWEILEWNRDGKTIQSINRRKKNFFLFYL